MNVAIIKKTPKILFNEGIGKKVSVSMSKTDSNLSIKLESIKSDFKILSSSRYRETLNDYYLVAVLIPLKQKRVSYMRNNTLEKSL